MRKYIKETDSAAPANAMGSSSTSSGPIQTFDPLLSGGVKKRKLLQDLVTTKPIKRVKNAN